MEPNKFSFNLGTTNKVIEFTDDEIIKADLKMNRYIRVKQTDH